MLFCSVTEGGIIELHFTMWGVLSVKSRKQITVCGYAVINIPAPMKALDKSFLLQISAKTKATKSCHCQTEEKHLAYTKISTSFCFPGSLSIPFDSCHSLHTMDQDYYEGTDYLSPVPADGDRTEEFEYEVRLILDIGGNWNGQY